MSEVLTFVVLGIANGSIYAIAGMGLVLTFKTSGIFNFAHGAQAAGAAYLMYTLRDQQGVPWPIAALIAIGVAGVIGGLLLERMAYTVSGEPPATKIAATVGLLVGLQALLVHIYGGAPLQLRPFLPTGTIRFLDVNVTWTQIIVTILAAISAAGLYVLFRRTRLGTSMQAVVDDPALLDLRGTDPSFVRRQAWIIGSCFASVSGLLLATFLGVDAGLLTLLVVFSFGAAAFGSFDSLVLTYVGGLVVGVGQTLSQRYLAQEFEVFQNLPANFPFVVLVIALLVMPTRKLIEHGGRAARKLPPPTRLSKPVSTGLGSATALVLLVVPFVFENKLTIWSTALCYVAIFASLGLLVQTSGLVSLCQITFAAIGSSTFAVAAGTGVPWPIAVLIGGLVTIPVGLIVALPAIRLSGVYLAIITFGFGLVVQRMVYPTFLMFGATLNRTAPRPEFGPIDGSDRSYYYVLLAGLMALVGLVALIRRSRLGRLLRSMSESPAMLAAHGVSTNVTKLFVFGASAFVAGIGGAMLGPIATTTTTTTFESNLSLALVAVLFIAGRHPVVAPFLAAGIYNVMPSYIDNPDVRLLTGVAFGAVALIIAMRLLPRLVDTASRSRRATERTRSRRPTPLTTAVRTAP